jgi:hypothetical protein
VRKIPPMGFAHLGQMRRGQSCTSDARSTTAGRPSGVNKWAGLSKICAVFIQMYTSGSRGQNQDGNLEPVTKANPQLATASSQQPGPFSDTADLRPKGEGY